jgi:hypothetical protein
MPRQLRVYNQFEELILQLEHVPGDPSPVRILEGTKELKSAIRSLEGIDFDRTAIVRGELRHFAAKWDSPDFLDALSGYWSSNFGWRTKLTETAPSFAFVIPPETCLNYVIASQLYQPIVSQFIDYKTSQVCYVGQWQDISAVGTADWFSKGPSKLSQLSLGFGAIVGSEFPDGGNSGQAIGIDTQDKMASYATHIGAGGWALNAGFVFGVGYTPVAIDPSLGYSSVLLSGSAYGVTEQIAIAEVSDCRWTQIPKVFPLLPMAA